MGFMDGEVLRCSKHPISDAAIATDYTQCPESFGGKQYRPFGCPVAGNILMHETLNHAYIHDTFDFVSLVFEILQKG